MSGTQTTTGYTYVPAALSSNVSVGGGQLQLSAPVGGVLIVEGRTVSVLKIGEGSVEYLRIHAQETKPLVDQFMSEWRDLELDQ